jgi:FkbM family methyltransferase
LIEHPRLAVGLLVMLRRLPGRRLRAAAGRNVSRPLLTRMATELDLPVADGFRMRVDTSEAIGRVLAVTGSWEPHVTTAFRKLLSPGDVVIDVGANIGYHTLLAAKLVGPGGHVYAFEPAAGTFTALTANIALNHASNVTALCIAAGAASGEATLDNRSWGGPLHSFIRRESESSEPSSNATSVQVEPVATFVQPEHLSRLRLVKIDVEGYEHEVLQGLQPLFDDGARPALILEVHPDATGAVPLLRELAERFALQGYRLYDERTVDHVAPWLDKPIELVTPLELGREPHVLLLPAARR